MSLYQNGRADSGDLQFTRAPVGEGRKGVEFEEQSREKLSGAAKQDPSVVTWRGVQCDLVLGEIITCHVLPFSLA
jgi:hypothetical protein